MKELRELITDPTVSAFLDILPHHDTVAVICTGLGERRFTTSQLAPLIAMHNAMPELLDAQEKWSALMFARQQGCETCPMNAEGDRTADNCGMCDVALFDCLPQWQKAWRDAQKIEGVE